MSEKYDMKAMLEAGVHFGHKTSRWHPKMAPYIHSRRNGAHIINLEKTVEALDEYLPMITKMVENGKKVLFVGTKKQLKEPVKEAAESVNMPYVTVRWVGGTLTNVETVNKQVKKMKDLERRMNSGELENRYSKLEVQRFQEEIDTLKERYGGIEDMTEQPAALIVVDACTDKNAIKEAKTLHIPVFAFTDTNIDPTDIDYVIPANDDSVKATSLLLSYVTDVIKNAKPAKVEKPAETAPKATAMAKKSTK